VARACFAKVREEAGRRGLLSDEHFTVDGTLIEANVSMKSFRKKGDDPPGGGRNAATDFRGQKRSNQTHEPREQTRMPSSTARVTGSLRSFATWVTF
jgi:hypothetical protein